MTATAVQESSYVCLGSIRSKQEPESQSQVCLHTSCAPPAYEHKRLGRWGKHTFLGSSILRMRNPGSFPPYLSYPLCMICIVCILAWRSCLFAIMDTFPVSSIATVRALDMEQYPSEGAIITLYVVSCNTFQSPIVFLGCKAARRWGTTAYTLSRRPCGRWLACKDT